MKKMIRPVAFGSKTGHRREIFNVPCKNPDKHKELGYHHNKLCRLCHDKWHKSLPWHIPLGKSDMDEDEALFEVLRVSEGERQELRNKPRFSATFRDCFSGQGKTWAGVACELFGVVIGERDNPDDYPFDRIVQKDKPNLIIRHLRSRFCFEPQRDGSPLYVEIQYRGFNETHASFKGMKSAKIVFPNDGGLPKPEMRTTPNNINRTWKLFNFLYLGKAPKSFKFSTGAEPGRPRGRVYITDENKDEILNQVIDSGRKLFQSGFPYSQTAIAETFGGLHGISSKKDIYDLVKICKKVWKRDILPEIKQS